MNSQPFKILKFLSMMVAADKELRFSRQVLYEVENLSTAGDIVISLEDAESYLGTYDGACK